MAVKQRSKVVMSMEGGFEVLYKEWMDAIMVDDELTVSGIIVSSSYEEREALIDPKVGPSSYKHQGEINICNGSLGEEQANEFEIDCPWILACCYGSTKTLKILYDEKVDIFYTDEQGDNCLHSMVKLGALHPGLLQTLTKTYHFLVDTLTLKEIRKLLMQENNRALRPLEEAMFHEAFALFNAMFYTKGVYLIKEVRSGIQMVQYFDVTEYEDLLSENRADKSPLLFLSLMSGKNSTGDSARDVVLSEPMNTWYGAKKNTLAPLIYAWAVFRILYMVLYFYSENILFSNMLPDIWNAMFNATAMQIMNISVSSNMAAHGQMLSLSEFERTMMIIALFLSACILLLDLVEFVLAIVRKRPWYRWRMKVKSNTMVQYTFYRVVQFTVAVLTEYLCTFVLIMSNPKSDMQVDVAVLQVK